MNKTKIKKLITIASILMAGVFLITGHFYNQDRFVYAEDEEDEEDERERDEDVIPAPEPTPTKTKTETKKIEYKTIYRQLPPTTVEIPVKKIRRDSDGDGLYDDEDAHPTVNDYFIVKDDNQNGVDDRYEQQNTPA